MTKTKRIQILCLLGAVALLLSGCWTEAPVESANGLLGDQEPVDQQEEVILPAAFTLPYDPDQTLDPVTCADGIQQVAGSLIYEGLFRLDRQLEPQPWLCQSYTYDAASLTYTFTLRSGVTFSDGSPLTAADAAATLRRAKSSQRYSARLAHVAAVSAGDGVVIVTLSRPDAGLPALLDIPIVKSGTEESLTPVGTAPYYFTTDEEGACLASHSGWWRGESRPVERISLSAARDREAMLEFLAVHEDALLRTNLTAHMTASAWVLSRDRRRVVMVYHNLYRSWSWTGGHADGGRDLLAVAMREVTEETGLRRLAPVTEGIFSLECLTVDGHEKRGEYVPSHIHMNVTYLLAAEDDALREKPDENSGVAWFTPEEALAASTEPWMVQRVYRKLADRAAAYMKT